MTRARRERLITEHMPVVRQIAQQVSRKFSPRLSVEDFIQDGCLGLCEAAKRCTTIASFQAFAYFRVRGAMVDAHRRKAYREELNPSLEGIAAASETRAANLTHHAGGNRTPLLSLASRDPGPMPDVLAAESERAGFLRSAIAELPEDERDVISQALHGVKLAAIGASRQRSATWARGKLSAARGKVTAAVAGRAA